MSDEQVAAMADANVYVLIGEAVNCETGVKGPAKCLGVYRVRAKAVADMVCQKMLNGCKALELPEGFDGVRFRVEEVPFHE